MPTLDFRSRISATPEQVFNWHARAGALERLTPPWEAVRVLNRRGGIENGARVELLVRLGVIPVRWLIEHRDFQPGVQFRDVQARGPFRRWDHLHRMDSDGAGGCVLHDRIEFEVPLGRVGHWIGAGAIRSKLARTFEYRHQVTRADLASLAAARLRGEAPMNVLVSGSGGLLGSALVPLLSTRGHRVTRLIRAACDGTSVQWDPDGGVKNEARLDGIEAVVHLAGENIANRRWTNAQKSLIRASRVEGTQRLAEALARMRTPPRVLVCASAIGFYGDRGEQVLDEHSPAGTGFLAEVCSAWERATQPASDRGIRVVHARFGVILSPRGGALKTMLTPFRLGLGGVVGHGRQYMSWVSVEDAVGAIGHVLLNDDVQGAVNVVSPNPVTNREFTRTLGRVLRRPTVVPMPGVAARLAFGEMADALLLASARVVPAELERTGYVFRHPDLESALRQLLGRTVA